MRSRSLALGFMAAASLWLSLRASRATAEPTEAGGWLGPRVYSSSSLLGYNDNQPFHPSLDASMVLGGRIARPFFPWLVPEIELGLTGTKTNMVGGASPATVFWFEPRIHVRFELMRGNVVEPFIVVGGGAPVALSSARKTFGSGIIGEGYVGGGARFDTHKGFLLRLDARVAIVPANPDASFFVTPEVDIGLGVEFHFGEKHRATPEEIAIAQGAPPSDRDGDGIPDAQDACPDRAEDKDGFEDEDGCPDIDNDLDRVLDIADKCPQVAETYNGFEDEDGCPDTVPAEVDAIQGTIAGLLYADGETVVRDSAKASLVKIAKVLNKQTSVKIVLVGHTDDREFKQFAQTSMEGQPPSDFAPIAAELARARAEAVKQALVALGVAAPRIMVEGHGPDEPVGDNEKPKGRLANRRVELRLYIPAH